ncbi:MAG: IPTL-CTERM sorting domain-containing protein [Comamonadaceae bacterium]|nr:MAG: IPTL-CTERM sorting domain-containing protein [Comamonadaceae bacterium]
MARLNPALLFMRLFFLAAVLWGGLTAASSAHQSNVEAPGLKSLAERQDPGVLFIHGGLADLQTLVDGAGAGTDVVVLDPHTDGLRQMADALERRHKVATVHLISHGKPGELDLGPQALDVTALHTRGADLARIRAALGDNAELLLYGCNVAEGQAGQTFIGALAQATGTRVAASTTLTGASVLGGDWVLEASTAPVRSAALAVPSYQHTLLSVAGTVEIPYSQPANSFSTPSLIDGQAGSGTVDIPNVVYEFYFANTGNTRVGGVTNDDLGGSGSMLHFSNGGQYDPVGALIIKTQSSRTFGLSSFRIQDTMFMNATFTLTGYRNGAMTVPGWSFTTNGFTNPVQIMPPAQFSNVDELRITSDGGVSGEPNKLYLEGFNSFVFAEPSANAALTGLTATAGALSPAFSTATTAYSIGVSNATTSTTVTPTVDTPGSTVTVNGGAVASGTASGSIALAVGSNITTTVVTARDGTTTKTYTLTITRAAPPSSNANLSSIALSSGALSPAFAAGTTSYTASVSFVTTTITLAPTVADSTASVTVNGAAVASGNPSGSIALAVGANTITTIVSAQDGSTKTYTTTVTRAAASGNNQLSALSLSSGTLTPVFASGTTSYTASVSNATTSLTVTPTVSDPSASVTVNGVATTSGNASGAIALAIGSNTVTVIVTAQNGSSRSYTITVTRASSANADLSALSLSSGTLSPGFASGTTSYTASVSNATTSLTVTPTVAAASATVTVNGVAVTSGNPSGSIALVVGATTITTVVTAPDGSTTKTYTVTVTRAASSNANLSGVSLSSGTLSPVFASGTISYTASVSAGTASLSVTPTTAVATASVTVNGLAVSSGTASQSIPMAPGSNTVTITVTAQNGTPKSYYLDITRAQPSSNSNLSALSLSSGTLAPAFAAGTTSYTASVSNATTALTVTPTVADATASVTVNGVATTSGTATGAIALAVGANTITAIVTAQDGATTKTYTVTVTRAGSANANLGALSLSSGTLSPAFASGTTSYTASVNSASASLTATPTVADANASVTVNGVATASGSASTVLPMTTGSNTVTVVVTAQDGTTTKTYTVAVTRAVSTNNDLSALVLSSGTLNPAFNAAQQSYTATVASAVASTTVTPTVADASASVAVNGVSVTSGSASGQIALNTGANVITVVATAQDGSPRSYTITVTRTALPTSANGASPSGGGTVTATLAGPAGCGFDRTAFIGLAGSPSSPPASPGIANYTFAQGLFDVEVGACPMSSTVTITLVYPQPFAAGSVYMKYGPTASNATPHWYVFQGAVVSGNTVTLTLTDGGAGDDDLVANGRIADPGGVALAAAVAPGGAIGIPTLSQWGLILMSLLLAGVAALRMQPAGPRAGQRRSN